MRTGSIAVAALLMLMACDGSGRRPGGPNGFTPSTPRDVSTPTDEDGGLVEGEDAREGTDAQEMAFDAGFAPDANTPPPVDAGMTFDAQPPSPDASSPPDVGFTFPDAMVRPDASARPDASPNPTDGGPPPAQTQISAIAGSSVLAISAATAEFTTTLQFDNAGPGAESLVVTGADVNVLISSHTFALTPNVHLAPVGTSQRGFTSVPNSVSPPVDPTLLTLACTLGMAIPTFVTLSFSNSTSVLIADTVLSCP